MLAHSHSILTPERKSTILAAWGILIAVLGWTTNELGEIVAIVKPAWGALISFAAGLTVLINLVVVVSKTRFFNRKGK